MATGKSTVYWDYIKIEELLALQSGIAESDLHLSNDEVMFISIHQIDELWFKLAIRELVHVRDLFARDKVREQSLSSAVRGIRRTALLFEQVARHFSLMETMTTRDYLAFRDKLSPASGFQSAQLREIEILLGLPDSDRIPLGAESSYMKALEDADGRPSPALKRVLTRIEDRPHIKEALQAWLFRTPIRGSMPSDAGDDAVVRGFLDEYLAAHEREVASNLELTLSGAANEKDRERLTERCRTEVEGARAFLLAQDRPEAERARFCRIRAAIVFIESYRELPLLAWPREVIDGIVALEQSFLVFRQRHARMVERVIGRRTGTGGSAGVDYLDQTALRYRVFSELWAVRTLLLRRDALPELADTAFYEFAGGH
jgi:tryptophan 2,3-dioxygenase